MQTLKLEGHWPYAQRRREPYLYVPFDVPPGAQGLHVAYSTSLRNVAGREHVDIGVFDPRGHAFCDAAGFRGWSGAARQEFVIGPTHATPGYRPGEIVSGAWRIILGTESPATDDVAYTIRVRFLERSPQGPELDHVGLPALFRQDSLATDPRYYRGDLHCHTVHSDGSHEVPVVAQRALNRGLDFLAITNHNVLATASDLPADVTRDLLLLPGIEVTTYRGHLNVWGSAEWLDFRAHTTPQMQQIVERARARGAVTSINHPREGGPDWLFDELSTIDCMEVWNGPWVVSNHQAVARYDRLLAAGRKVTAVGGSDIHVVSLPGAPFPFELGNPTTHVYSRNLSAAALLEGLRAGRVCVTAEPEESPVELRATAAGRTAMMGEEIAGSDDMWRVSVEAPAFSGAVVAFVADGRQVVCCPVERARDIEIAAPGAYVRAEILREACDDPGERFVLALTNPIYRARNTPHGPRSGSAGADC